MKRINFINRFFQAALLMMIISALTNSVIAQSESSDKTEENGNQVSLENLTEAILVNGKPTLKILSRKKGGYTEVKLQKLDGEDALVFDVVKSANKNPVGKLSVTRSKVVFNAFERKESNLIVDKTSIAKFVVKKSLDGFPSIELDFNNSEARFTVKFDRYQHLIDRTSQRAVHNLLYRAIEDFDSALKEFNELTKTAFPN